MKWTAVAQKALLGIAVLAATPQIASADPTTLICKLGAENSWKEDEPTTVDLNEAQSSVVVHWGAKTLPINGAHTPALSSAPVRGDFSANTISFNAFGQDYVIIRLTGVMSAPSINWTWSCEPGNKKF